MAKRDIIKIVEQIKLQRFEDIISSDLSVNLLWAYSQLFLNGSEPSWCAKCMSRYYTEIQLKGTEMAINLVEAQNRTCIPKWKGLKYIQRAGRHYDNTYITDVQAIELLNAGLIGEDQFTKLPDGYIKNIPVGFIPEVKIENEIIEIPEKTVILANKKKAKK